MLFKFIVISLLSFGCMTAHSQMINWQKTKGWKLFNYFRFEALHLPLDSLKQYQSVYLNDSQIRRMLKSADSMKGPTKNIQWMGLFTVTYQYQNTMRKMEISQYGGFFFDDTTKTYYELDGNDRYEWQNYFANLDLSPFNTLPIKEIK